MLIFILNVLSHAEFAILRINFRYSIYHTFQIIAAPTVCRQIMRDITSSSTIIKKLILYVKRCPSTAVFLYIFCVKDNVFDVYRGGLSAETKFF